MNHNIRFTLPKLQQRLTLIESLVYRHKKSLAGFRYQALANTATPSPVGANIDDSGWPVIEPDTYWSAWNTMFVLRGQFQVPAAWSVNAPVALLLSLGESGDPGHPEALAYIDGQPYAAIDRQHHEIELPARYRDGQPHDLALHGWTGRGGWFETPPTQPFMPPCAIVQIDTPTRDFVALVRVGLGTASSLNDHDPVKGLLLSALDNAFLALDTREPFGDRFYDSVSAALDVLRDGIAQSGLPHPTRIAATGHAHLDVAWLWTLDQTRLKAARTFHNVLRLMEQFPEYHFTQSQPQLYDYVRQDFPDLFEAIKQRITEGRWEPIGGMWVEADCNLSGAESLARQFVLGRAFFCEHFGPDADSPVLWLPDVFGYAWNLPQLIKEAGMEYFFTVKIGWNEYNRLPYDSFWWQGLDGTRVLTHFSATPGHAPGEISTYNAWATPDQIINTWRNFQQKDDQHELLTVFGYGDGGGGPTRDMLENLREMAHFPGMPQVRQTGAADFFRTMENESGNKLPTWNAELYLEFHRGTYTTQARNKRANRKTEFLLHDAEFLSTWATLLDNNYVYPATELKEAWQLTCLNQFHDIIPGSSIAEVYTESLTQYEAIRTIGETARDSALEALGSHLGGQWLLVNTTSFERADLAYCPDDLSSGQGLERPDGSAVNIQPAQHGGTWLDAGPIPPYGAVPLQPVKTQAEPLQTSLSVAPDHLENEFLRVEFNADGDITRIYDKRASREVLPPDAIANQFQAFEDRPLKWDAWNIDSIFEEKMWLAEPATSVKVVEAGPLQATLETQRTVLSSRITQQVSLAYNSPRIDFETRINWQEKHTLLKVAFPVDILSPTATYEIQWGNVERPTHRNTSWDWARFETCAQKWVDLSEGDYGVSLLNDCKYGHDIRDNVVRLSLLRSPSWPDPDADQGEHRFTYSLLPHGGRWDRETVAAAYALNAPLLVHATNQDNAGNPRSFLQIDRSNMVIETVKQAEDGQGVIVRLYENQRQRGTATLQAGFPLTGAWRTNLLEENQVALDVADNTVTFTIKPYQIITLRLIPA